MRKWGIVITAFYSLVIVILVVPGVSIVSDVSFIESFTLYNEWFTWVWLAILLGGQAILLFVSVDTSWRRLRPRQHVFVSVATIALLMLVLTYAVTVSLIAGVSGESFDKNPIFTMLTGSLPKALTWLFGLWLMWGIFFYLYLKRKSYRLDQGIGWLIKGSILELLVAVPCHIIVRHRDDCSAPILTGFGIASGIAIMLLSFGPSVLFLFKKRMEQYKK